MKNYKVSGETICRTIVLAITLVNQVLVARGFNPFPVGGEEIYATASTVATMVAAIVAWWKNNSFTQEAIKADKVLAIEKSNKDVG